MRLLRFLKISKWRAKSAPVVPNDGTMIFYSPPLLPMLCSTFVYLSLPTTLPLRVVFLGMSLILMAMPRASTTFAGDSNFLAPSICSNILMSCTPLTFLPERFINAVSAMSRTCMLSFGDLRPESSATLIGVLSGRVLPKRSGSRNRSSLY